MAWPTTARLDVLIEIQLNTGEWVDITSAVYGDPDSDHIELQRGRTSEAGAVGASTAHFRLKNRDGKYSPRNPRSAYYGLFGRNSPVRVCVRPRMTTGPLADLTDTFTRTVALGDTWGVSDTGQTWSKSVATPVNKLSVSGGLGRMLLSTTADATAAQVTGASWKDFDAYVTFTFPVATGASTFAQLSSRTVETATADRGARLRTEMTTTGAVNLQVVSTFPEGAAATVSTVLVSGLTHTGQALRMRMKLAGITVMGKVWAASGSEPAAWQIIADDTVSLLAKPPASLLLSTLANVGNTNVPFTATYDDIAVTVIEPRYCGELTSVPPRWTPGAPTAGDAWVEVSSAGIIGRLSSVQDAPKSPLWRFVESNQTGLIGYWTLNVGEPAGLANVQFQRPLLGTLTARDISAGGAAVSTFTDMGNGNLQAGWLENGAAFTVGGFISLDRVRSPSNSGAGWSLDWVRTGAQNIDFARQERVAISTSFTVTNPDRPVMWEIDFDASTSDILVVDPNLTLHTAAGAGTVLYDGAVHAIRFTTTKSGANITYNLLIDSVSVISGSVVDPYGKGADAIDTVSLQVGGDQSVAYGHFAVWDATGASAADYADAALGHPGEGAVERIGRVCVEQGIPYYAIGETTGTSTGEALGPQPIGTPYSVIAAAAAADQGVLTELRDANGLLFLARETLYANTPLALTYTTDGHLQPGLEPTDDDAFTVNTSTVTRQFASSQTFERTDSPLGSASPPVGVGRKPNDPTLNVASDVRALHAAEWLVALGTVDDSRWPVLPVALHHLATHALTTLLSSVIRADAGTRITVDHPPSFLPPGTIDQLVLGDTEVIDQFLWSVGFNCAPYAAYNTAVWDSTSTRWDAANSTLAAGVTSSATSLSVATSSGSLWTTSAGNFPFDIGIGGVRITVTNITGGASPQTFTVTRSVDGFDLALAINSKVSLWRPNTWGL